MDAFPVIRVTSAPLSMAAFASAKPIFPEEWLLMNLTGSMDSLID